MKSTLINILKNEWTYYWRDSSTEQMIDILLSYHGNNFDDFLITLQIVTPCP